MNIPSDSTGEVLLYETPEGDTRLDVRMQGETVWLSQQQMADLFERDKSAISRHVKNIFESGELDARAVVAEFATTARDGKTYQVEYFSLDVIIAVGYRVNSRRGTQFRIWATQRLRDYLVKGFALDDRRFKESGPDRYFDELLDRIRDIRISERMFYEKVRDIYTTSSDYDPHSDVTQQFFATVQNKLHFAVHGHTAAELIDRRVDAAKPNMGLTNFPGDRILARDVTVAKNYLTQDELQALGLLVEQYLAFAELQARNRREMKMQDWVVRLDEILRMNALEILTHAGRIAKKLADEKALTVYDQFREERRRIDEAVRDAKTAEVLAKTAAALPKPGKPPRKPQPKKK